MLDPGVLVIDVEGGGDALGEDAGTQPSRGAAGNAAIKDQLDLVGAVEIEVLADHLFEKQPAMHPAPGSEKIQPEGPRYRSGSRRSERRSRVPS
jgi:hypothetical protein